MRFCTYRRFCCNSKCSWVHSTQHPHKQWELHRHSFHQAFRADEPRQANTRTSREFIVRFRWEEDRRLRERAIRVSFAEGKKVRIEMITFDIVNMDYPCTAIFGKGVLSRFKIVIKQSYLCMKMPSPFGIITVHGD